MATPIINKLEQGLGTVVKEGVENWLSKSGRTYLKKLGLPEGEVLANTLDHYEAFRDSAQSKSKLLLEDIHNPTKAATATQRLGQYRRNMQSKLSQSGTAISPSVTDPHVYHPDLRKVGSKLRTDAIKEIRTAQPNFSVNDAGALIDRIMAENNTRHAASHMLDPIFPLQTGRLPIKEAYKIWGDKVSERVAQNLFFGAHDENIGALITSIAEKKGRVSAGNVASFMDIFLHQTQPGAYHGPLLKQASAYKGQNAAEQLANKIGSYILTSRIALPHASQWVTTFANTAAEGFKPLAKGIFDIVTDYKATREWVLQTGALDEELNKSLQNAIVGKKSVYSKYIEPIIKQPGFHWVRAREIEFSAIVGKHRLEEAARRILANGNDQEAKAILGKLGVDFRDVIATKGVTSNMQDTAAHFAVNDDIFLKSPSNVPFKWMGTPFGRTISMYKPFSFNMGRTIYNGLKTSYERGGVPGVLRTLAVLGTLFPVMGELVALGENVVLGNPSGQSDTPFTEKWKTDHYYLDHYLNAIAHVGGFGVTYSLLRAAKRRMMASQIIGPIASSFLDFAMDVGAAIIGKEDRSGETHHDWKPVGRDITRKIPIVGPALSKELFPYEDKSSGTIPTRRPSRHNF